MAAFFLFVGPFGQNHPAAGADSPDWSALNSDTHIGVIVQEYAQNNPVEILLIQYDGSLLDFEEFGGKNPEIEMLNHEIKAGPLKLYQDFQDGDLGENIDILSYPFENEEFVQIVTTSVVYPETRPDLYTHLWSYNFNKTKNQFLDLDDIIKEAKLTRDDISSKFKQLYKTEDENEKILEVNVTGFLITKEDEKNITNLLIEATMELESDPYKGFYLYAPSKNELRGLSGRCLFKARDFGDLVAMDPPMEFMADYCQESEGSYRLSMNVTGLDELTPNREYMLDGLTVWPFVFRM
jgi:hypothetical protein